MRFAVRLTDQAAHDLEGLYDYIAAHDSQAAADLVLDRIEEAIATLEQFPERGSYPRELLSVGIREYREVFLKPYRIVCRIIGEEIYIYLVADGKRDMQSLLQRRILGN